tara:strand:- start:2708 stop:3124 length:417 start_codon:yes stop_codon:yes gene_type:complete
MLKETKYYTPTIEEFHIGFEYEMWRGSKRYGKWDKDMKFGVFSNINAYYVFIEDEELRVKYLNQEDIESLGFHQGYSAKDGRNYITYINKDVVIKQYYNNNNEYAIVIQLKNSQRTLFDGFIKNKSELKKLLKQLNID